MDENPAEPRRLRGKLFLALGSTIVTLLLAEFALWATTKVLRPRFTKVDPVVGWYHYPNTAGDKVMEGHEYRISYNQHGFRPPDHEYGRLCRRLRAVVLGDSFADGSEVGDDENAVWITNEALPDVDVVNLGVYGYSTAQELLLLEDRGLRYEPDLVVVLTMGNDLWNNLVNFSFFGPTPRFVLSGDSLALQGTRHPSAQETFRRTNLPGPRFLHQHSHLYYLLNHYGYQVAIADRIETLREEQVEAVPHEERVELYLRLIDRVHEAARSVGADLLVVVGYERGEFYAPEEAPQRDLAGRLEERGIAAVDMYEALLAGEAQTGASIYWDEDSHWNVAGHRVAGDFLAAQAAAWKDGLAPEHLGERLDRGCD